jgi:hypothetical protein
VIVATSSGALCRTWYVTADGTGDAATIQAGVDSAAAGDTVLVAPGSYPHSTQRLVDGETASVNVFIDHDITLIAEGSPDTTIIDASGSEIGVYVVLATVEIRGFQIAGQPMAFGCVDGLAQVSLSVADAGVRCDSSVVAIVGNRMHDLYYGVQLRASPLATVEANELYNVGAAIVCEYGSDATVSENVIHGCAVGVRCLDSPSILGNEIRNEPGYLSCYGILAGPGSPYISENRIRGMYNGGILATSSSPIIENNRIEFNREGIQLGGGQGARIAGNFIRPGFLSGINLFGTQNALVERNTIVGYSGSAGIEWVSAGTDTIRNNNIVSYGNGIGVDCLNDNRAAFSCNNVVARTRYRGCTDRTGIDGNISVDPLFCGVEDGDYSLSSNSPCAPGNHPDGHDCGLIGAYEMACSAVTSSVMIATDPSDLEITVDDSTYAAPQTFTWDRGSVHSISVPSPQPGASGIQYVYSNWSDGGTQSHAIATPSTDSTFTAALSIQYYLTMTASPNGSVAPASGWHDAGAQLQIQATPVTGYVFDAWTGVGNGSYTGSSNPATITMNGPISQLAQFKTAPNVTITIATFPNGRQIIVDGTTWIASRQFVWQVGSAHTIGVPSPQDGDPGVRYVYVGWSDRGLQTHTIVTAPINSSYNASFATRYYLTTVANGGSISPSAGWWNAGQSLQIRATAEQGSEFVAWSGTGNGSYTGPDNPTFIAMYGPVAQTAQFKVIPAEFALHQNYPNPFNPTTTIDFDLPEKSHVTLRVYDISGRVVQVLLDRVLMDPGEQSSSWDGTTSDGRSAPSGVYLCRIEAGPFSQTRRLVLLR